MTRLAALFVSTALLGHAQNFEAASVRAAAPYKGGPINIGVSGGPGTDDPGHMKFSNATMSMLLEEAFGVEFYRISGPKWLPADMFDIQAALPPGTTKEQMRAMLQNLLADRFRIAFHREKREIPSYVLTVGKNGPKMKNSIASDDATSGSSSKAGRRVVCKGCTMAMFAGKLEQDNGRVIFDETGLTGTYDFDLLFEPTFGPCPGCDGPPPSLAADTTREKPPILLMALQQQLGLKLESKKSAVEMILIDYIERTPIAN